MPVLEYLRLRTEMQRPAYLTKRNSVSKQRTKSEQTTNMQRLIARCIRAGGGGLRPFRNQVEVHPILLYPDHIESVLI